jgi:Zn-dependent protease
MLAFLFTGAYWLAHRVDLGAELARPLFMIVQSGILMNVALAVFNLVPLPPLDGSWIVSWGLPRSIASRYDRLVEPYGQWILLILFATGILGAIISPFIQMILTFLSWLVF